MSLITDIRPRTPAPASLGVSLFDASEDCVKLVDLDGRLLDMNVNGRCLMEIDDLAALRGRPWVSLWPDDERPKVEAALEEALAGRSAKFVADCPTIKGTEKSWEVTVWPVLDIEGQPAQVVSISRDVTDRVRMETDNALLTRELAHRIRNMFAVVDGVIGLSARATTEARPFADALRKRLHGLGAAIAYVLPAHISGRLGETPNTLHGLLDVLLQPYEENLADGRVRISGDNMEVGDRAVTSLALAVNELATNALKHGALKDPGGRVEVQTRLACDALTLLWRELHSGVTADAGEGFGSVLLENAVVRQLGGAIERHWGEEGLELTLTMPRNRLSR